MWDLLSARLKRFHPWGKHRTADEHLVAFSKNEVIAANRIPADPEGQAPN